MLPLFFTWHIQLDKNWTEHFLPRLLVSSKEYPLLLDLSESRSARKWKTEGLFESPLLMQSEILSCVHVLHVFTPFLLLTSLSDLWSLFSSPAVTCFSLLPCLLLSFHLTSFCSVFPVSCFPVRGYLVTAPSVFRAGVEESVSVTLFNAKAETRVQAQLSMKGQTVAHSHSSVLGEDKSLSWGYTGTISKRLALISLAIRYPACGSYMRNIEII